MTLHLDRHFHHLSSDFPHYYSDCYLPIASTLHSLASPLPASISLVVAATIALVAIITTKLATTIAELVTIQVVIAAEKQQ